MRFLYLSLSLLPTLAVLTLAWFVIRAISVRVVWRAPAIRRVDDGEAARSQSFTRPAKAA